MKAVVLHKLGDISELDKNLLIEEVHIPEISGDEVLIKIQYASLNHRDVWITKGLLIGAMMKLTNPLLMRYSACRRTVLLLSM